MHHGSKRQLHNKFCAVDGEGMTINGIHRYVLLTVGQESIEDSDGLYWEDIFDFLYSQRKNGVSYIGFFLGYDFSQWFKTLPEDRARMLLTIRGRSVRQHKVSHMAPHPVECDGWQFDILGFKRLRIRPKLCKCEIQSCQCAKAPWMYICDAGSFFQTSFVNVINPKNWKVPIVTPEEYAVILEGKGRRDIAVLDDSMRMYNRLENQILERVMEALDDGFHHLGIHLSPSKWYGPGQAAQDWLNKRAPTREMLCGRNRVEYKSRGKTKVIESLPRKVPKYAWNAAVESYYGGWFEIMMHGIIPGITYEYDINSAYPFVIAHLPCLLHGKWTRGAGKPNLKPNDLCLVRARVWESSPRRSTIKGHGIGSMLHRDDHDSICRPLITEGWYWTHELDAAHRARCITRITRDRYFEWVKYEPCDCKPPLWQVKNLYQMRLDVGKETPLGKACKLVPNSLYGKFAQSIGEPIFGNAIYASLITSGCRTMILDAIATHPGGKHSVAMVATDAVYFTEQHPTLPLSKELGRWEEKVKNNLTLFKPGVYWDDKARIMVAHGDTPEMKARGINARDFAKELEQLDAMFAEWDGNPPAITNGIGIPMQGWPTVDFVLKFAMTTALQALIRNDWTQAGKVHTDIVVTQSSNPHKKRTAVWYDSSMGVYRSEPHAEGAGSVIDWKDGEPVFDVASKPYRKQFGEDDPWSQESLEQFGLTPDGYPVDPYQYVLMGQ